MPLVSEPERHRRNLLIISGILVLLGIVMLIDPRLIPGLRV